MMLCSSQCIISRVTYQGHHIHEPCNERCELLSLGLVLARFLHCRVNDKYVVLT